MKSMNQQIIKNSNLKHVLSCVQSVPGISRAEISKALGLSKPAVSSLVDELIENNFLTDSGAESNKSVGRNPNSLYLNSNYYCGIVFYIRQNKLLASVVNIVGKRSHFTEIPISKESEFLEQAKKYLESLTSGPLNQERILSVCFVVPAMIDVENKRLYSASIAFNSESFLYYLKKYFSSYNIAVLNNTACMAYAEKVYTHVEDSNFAFINMGHGIGSALFLHGELLGKATGYYMQIGHYSVDFQGPQCSCGKKGCLEVVMREDTLPERLKAAGASSAFAEAATFRSLGEAALYGDPTSREVISSLAYDFSKACINMICLVHPGEIILGGSRAPQLGPYFVQCVQDNIQNFGSYHIDNSIRVRLSQLDANAVYNGAIKYYFDTYYNFLNQDSTHLYLG